jgi:hypothetical protein
MGNNIQVKPSHYKQSKGEKRIASILDEKGIVYQAEYSFPGCTRRYDFYIPKYNKLVEFDGEQHFRKSHFQQTLAEVQAADIEKTATALNKGRRVVRIHYRWRNRDDLPHNLHVWLKSREKLVLSDPEQYTWLTTALGREEKCTIL